MLKCSTRKDSYNTLHMETPVLSSTNAAPTLVEPEHEDSTNVLIHQVQKAKPGWTHIDDLDSFFTRMYKYYLKGGFYPMVLYDFFYLLQLIFIAWFLTFLVHCVNYPKLFRNDGTVNMTVKVTLSDVIYPTSVCVAHISWRWWILMTFCAIIWLLKLALAVYHLYHAYDTKLFYNHALKIADSELGWINWSNVQEHVREAQLEHHMCVHKRDINELDIYHRILRFNNYLVAMVNKNVMPLQVHVPLLGSFHYLSRGLKYNLEFLLFSNPWSPWENCWQLRECYKEYSKRIALAKQLEKQIMILALVNLMLCPLTLAWQILYFFFNYAELIKRSPASLGLRMWSLYARIALRHFNELDHELKDRLNRAHKPATKYLGSFSSPITTVVGKYVLFLSASVLSVLVVLSVYDEDVLSVEHVLALITILGCILAGARALIGDEDRLDVGCAGIARSEELFVQVLGQVHYLPAAWRGRAHTKEVAAHFQELFQFRAVYILFELLSPIFCPLVLYSLKSRALDIVDFYRNFTISVLGIGDVCSFAQLDIRRHGHPDWRAPGQHSPKTRNTQYNQSEGRKTELSLVAFSCRHPGWHPSEPAQRQFLRSIRQSMHMGITGHTIINKTMLGSYVQQSLFGTNSQFPAVLSYYQQRQPCRLPSMEESDEEEIPQNSANYRNLVNHSDACHGLLSGVDYVEPPLDMSASALHLYDLYLSQAEQSSSGCCARNCNLRVYQEEQGPRVPAENTPLLYNS